MILYLVPSIALLAQVLREWTADAKERINPVCICSDAKVTKKIANSDFNTTSVIDLALPASTDVNDIVHQLQAIEATKKAGMTVVFSTYQSIDVIQKAQKVLSSRSSSFKDFDFCGWSGVFELPSFSCCGCLR